MSPARPYRLDGGSIPAWAGETLNCPGDGVTAMSGLSPRGRGNLLRSPSRWAAFRSIPAWAGKPPSHHRPSRMREVYPRVGGETARPLRRSPPHTGLSPRGRGNPDRSRSRYASRGSIPAWAGKPASLPRRPFPNRVYPRVGGETYGVSKYIYCNEGLSPRGRGNLCVIMTQFRKRMNMSKIDGPTEIRLPYGESGATRAARQVVLDGAAPQ